MDSAVTSPRTGRGPWGDADRHLPSAALESGYAGLAVPADIGSVACIVVRCPDGTRATPQSAAVTQDQGLEGDRWSHHHRPNPENQITVMRADVARLVANGQPLTIFGDNLLVELDLSASNLPSGSRLRIGNALLEVTPLPHTGCAKFRQRVGEAALALTADPRFVDDHLRGIHVRVVEPGTVSVGDGIRVVRRGPATGPGS